MSDSIDIETDLVIEDFGILSFEDSDEEQQDLTSILHLPEEILVQIFSYISLQELYHSVALVCKLFCRLTRDPGVRRCVSLSGKGLTVTKEAASFVSEAHNLKSLSLKNRGDSNTLVTAALLNCRNLKILEVRFCQPLTESTLSTFSGSSVVSKLEYFSLEGTGVCVVEPSNASRRHLFASAHNLRHLDLFGCKFLEPEDLVRINVLCFLIVLKQRFITVFNLYLIHKYPEIYVYKVFRGNCS